MCSPHQISTLTTLSPPLFLRLASFLMTPLLPPHPCPWIQAFTHFDKWAPKWDRWIPYSNLFGFPNIVSGPSQACPIPSSTPSCHLALLRSPHVPALLASFGPASPHTTLTAALWAPHHQKQMTQQCATPTLSVKPASSISVILSITLPPNDKAPTYLEIQVDGQGGASRCKLTGAGSDGIYTHVVSHLAEGATGMIRVRVKGGKPKDLWSKWSSEERYEVRPAKEEEEHPSGKRGAAKVERHPP